MNYCSVSPILLDLHPLFPHPIKGCLLSQIQLSVVVRHLMSQSRGGQFIPPVSLGLVT